MSSSHTSSDEPTIAVVICTRDRTGALIETLQSIWAQTRLPDELVIVDDGRLPEAVQGRLAERCRGLGIAWRYERSRSRGLTRSRNLAARLAQSEVLQYLDDDVTCDAGFLAEIARIMREPSVAGVTATVEEPSFATRSARLYQLGYRVAGWWRVSPRVRPAGARPSILGRPDEAVPARWLSGAAMALRRDIVRAHGFDEDLAEYALGEDRELGYRLAPHYWLVQAKQARVVHRREMTQRIEPHALGFMTSFNYLRILGKTCRLGPGDWLVIVWGLAVLAAMHAVWAVWGSRRDHLAELCGMLDGVVAAVRTGVRGRSTGDGGSSGSVPAGTHTRRPIRQTAKPSERRPTRVLFVTNRLEAGGAEWMLLSLIKHLRHCGVLPFVGCLKDAGPLAGQCREHGTAVFDNLLKFKVDAGVLLRLRRILADNEIDVIVAAHSGGDRMFWSALAGRLCDVPVVVWSHWFPVPGARHFERANRALYRFVDVYVAVGRAQRLAMVRHEQVPAGRITVIPNAIEVDRFLGAAPGSESRRRLGLADHHTAIAIIANCRREKRHDVFIEAAGRLAARDADLRFFIIGDGPNREAVEAAAAASGLDDETLRLLGARDDVSTLLPGIDISCLCSEQECFSVTMLEAAAAGCAFIGPGTGCMTEFLEHRRTGLVIRPADVESLADAMEELVADGGLRRRLAQAARERVVRDHDIGRMAGMFSGLFTRLERRG